MQTSNVHKTTYNSYVRCFDRYNTDQKLHAEINYSVCKWLELLQPWLASEHGSQVLQRIISIALVWAP